MYVECPHVETIIRKELGIPEKDIKVDNIIQNREYPFDTEIYYRVINRDGEEIFVKKNVMGMIYDELLSHWLKCKYIDKKTKEILKKEKEELDKAWNEYIRDP